MYHSRYDNGRLPMKPGIVELLKFLKENGIKTAVASSTRKAVVTREITDAGLLSYFDVLICGDMVARSKPAPDIFLKAAEELKVDPSRSYVIEDSYNGIRAAHSAGMRAFMVPDMLEANDEMRKLSEAVLPDLMAVKEALTAHFVETI